MFVNTPNYNLIKFHFVWFAFTSRLIIVTICLISRWVCILPIAPAAFTLKHLYRRLLIMWKKCEGSGRSERELRTKQRIKFVTWEFSSILITINSVYFFTTPGMGFILSPFFLEFSFILPLNFFLTAQT